MPTPTPTPIWLDVDTGHDDAFAILLAARHPSANLLGISTVFGNASLSNTTHNTLAILSAIHRTDVPVYAGAAKPFCREAQHAPDIHGESGLDGTTCLPTPAVGVRSEAGAVEAAYQALMRTAKGTAWFVATGALTNAALLLSSHPELVGHLAGISIMGGAIGGGFTDAPMGFVAEVDEAERFGNVTPYAEFNIWTDPESAAALLQNPEIAAKTVLVTLDLTHQFLATPAVQRGLLYGYDAAGSTSGDVVDRSALGDVSLVRKLFLEIVTFFAGTYASKFGITAGPPVHDLLAVAAAIMPELFDSDAEQRFNLDVVRGGSQDGRTIAKSVTAGANGSGVRIPKTVQTEKVWRMLDESLTLAENEVAT